MLDILFTYSGADWAAMILIFFLISRLGAKHRDGFLYGLGVTKEPTHSAIVPFHASIAAMDPKIVQRGFNGL